MGVDSFKVTFNKPKRGYYHGDTLGVVVHIFSKDGFKLNSITLHLIGNATTEWSERSVNRVTNYTGKEVYFDKKFTLFEKPQGNAVEIPPGEYTYVFAFVVPKGIPPSFIGKKGSIQYYMNVIMDRPWKFNDTIHEPFVIFSGFDLNDYPSLREPGGTLMEKEFCCCFNSGNVTAVVKIPCRGFIPGQKMPVSIQIENNSNSDVADIYVTMLRRDAFHMAGKSYSTVKTQVVKHAQSTGVKVKAKSAYAFYLPYVVPKVPIYNLMECNIIDVTYLLEFEFKFSGTFALGMIGKLPFLVGKIPLENMEMPDDFPNN